MKISKKKLFCSVSIDRQIFFKKERKSDWIALLGSST
jgi:hypothetical protein